MAASAYDMILLKKAFKLVGIVMAAGIMLTAGCAATMWVPVMRPGAINLRGVNRIGIGDISGPCGLEIGDLLAGKLAKTGKLDVLERASLARMMKEHGLQLSAGIDARTAPALGTFVGAGSLVFGKVTTCRYRVIRTYVEPMAGKDGKIHYRYYVKGTAAMNVTFKMVSMQTGEKLAEKTITREMSEQYENNEDWPKSPNGDALLSKVKQQTVDAFIKMITPSTGYATITFAKNDPKIPEMERGVAFAKKGLWNDALEQFRSAAMKNPTHKGAWFDLGLAYEYTSRFKEAKAAFNNVNWMGWCPECQREIAKVTRMAQEHKNLEESIHREVYDY